MPVGPSVAAQAAAHFKAHKPRPTRRRWLIPALIVLLAAVVCLAYALVPWTSVLSWAAAEQRAAQNAMAGYLRAIRSGDAFAILALCGVTAAYGFVHALGPGHGKVLLGGAALATDATMQRMAVLTVASSLCQAASAMLLVFFAMGLLNWVAKDVVGWTEAWLAPASAVAIAAIGTLLMVRGLRAVWLLRKAGKREGSTVCGCGYPHGPTISQVQGLQTVRDAFAIITSIAIRPCTGALFLLVIAWRLDIVAAGCLAVVTMSLGTASFNLLVAGSGVAARRLASLPLDSNAIREFSAGVHIFGGLFIATMSIALARTYLDMPSVLP